MSSPGNHMQPDAPHRGTRLDAPHRVWRLGADIDTDVLAPGHAMKNVDTISQYCLESVRPEFAGSVRPGDVIAAGPNFGIGSSREQAASVLVQLGVSAVIAPSFGGLYFRNAFNLGLLLLTCKEAELLAEGEQVQLDLSGDTPTIVSAAHGSLLCEPVPDFLMDMVRHGGLLNQLRQRLGKKAAEELRA
jgi:3-isopropylmalate/(R)-2-methylmalate dehydratase small subunit